MIRRISLLKYTQQGERLPKCYGLAWHEYNRNVKVCMPIPLNIICRLFRELYYILARGVIKSRFEERIRRVESAAYGEGWSRGFREGQEKWRNNEKSQE